MAEHAGTVRRREDPRLVTGRGEFVDDLRIPGCLHAAMVRSPHAHARIRAIDVSAARRARGVVGVFTAADLGRAGEPMPIYAPHPALPVPCRIRPLATDRARFVGEAVVAVIADSVYRAHDALALVRAASEPLPAVVDVEAALAPGAPRLHDELATNVAAEWRQRVGDVEAAFPTADVRVRTRIRLARGGAHPLEPRGLVVRWDDDRLTVWGAVQMVHRHRDVIAGQLGVPAEHVRVIAPPDVGGGFGTKGMYYPEYIVVAALARSLGRPIKWIETRREHTLVACVERDQIHDVEIAATRDGKIVALRDDFLHDMGAYTISGLNLPQNAMIHSVGPYVIPHLDLRFRGVVTTTTPVGPYRGAGRPYGTAVIERAMDALARESAIVRVRPDGGVTIVSGAAPQGQGHVTLFSHLIGDVLGVDPETIDVLTGDSALVATGGGTYGSRTAAIGGSAALLAGRVVRDKAIRIAAHLLEAAPVDVVCGRVLQPMIVDGQIPGGVVQGIADALNVQLAYDETGQRLTATLMDYTLATAADAPRSFELRHLESPTPLNPLGAKGAGEGGIMPIHPLIAQAIEDALAPFGARVERVPVTRAEIAAMARHGRAGPA